MPLSVTYIAFLLLLRGSIVLTRYEVGHPGSINSIHSFSKDVNLIASDEASRSTIKHTKLKHRWIIEHFREQDALRKLTPTLIQSAEFSSPDNEHKFRMSFESAAGRGYWSSWRALVLHSLGGNYSFSCKVQLDIVYTSHEGERLNNTLEKFIHVNNTGEDTQIARVILPPLEEYIDNNGALTFLCTITTFGHAITLRENASINTNSEAFVNSFKRILEAKTGTDLDTVPSDCVITAQKSIFFVRSPKIDTTIQMAKESNLHNVTHISCYATQCVVSYVFSQKCS